VKAVLTVAELAHARAAVKNRIIATFTEAYGDEAIDESQGEEAEDLIATWETCEIAAAIEGKALTATTPLQKLLAECSHIDAALAQIAYPRGSVGLDGNRGKRKL
jgi:hypothetical protein